MGHTFITAIFSNPFDYAEHVQGKRKREEIRNVAVEALVDTGATFPALPQDLVNNLGLFVLTEVDGETAEGQRRLKLTLALVEIDGRTAATYVIVRPLPTTPLIGVTVLEQMGYRVDPISGKLIRGIPLML